MRSSHVSQSGDSPELAQGLPYKGKSMRNRGVSSPMPFLLIPRSLLRGGFIAFGLLQEETIDNDRIFEKPVVLLRPMLLFLDGEDRPSTMGHVSRRGHIGEQDEAARLFLHTTDALGVWSYGCLQPLA